MRLSGTKTGAINQYRGLGDQLWDLGGARPTLDLNFAHLKNLTDATSGKDYVDFTRASSGTYVGSDGLIKLATTDEARFDHDPTTGESLGLLLEDEGRNLLQRTEEFDDNYWTKASSSTATPYAGASPDGLTTAETYTTTGAAQSIFNGTGVTVTAGTAYTFSVYVKLGTMSAANYMIAVYDLSNSAFIAVDIAPTIAPTASSWSRVTYTFTAPSGCTSVRVYPFRNGSSITSSTVHLWGAQLEAGSFPTSYIKNVDAVLGTIRAADVASISGGSFSSWYRQDEGTVFVDVFNREIYSGTNLFPYVAQFDDGTNTERISLDHSVLAGGYRTQYVVRDVYGPQASITAQLGLATGAAKWSAAYGLASFASASNGAVAVAVGSGTVPTVNRLQIGTGFGAQYNGTIKRLTYWPQRLPNATLQNITT